MRKGAEIVFPPKLSGSSDRSASLCHISLRRSSQRLAGCVWPGLTTGGARVLGQTLSLQPALPAERPALPALHSLLAGGKSGSRWGVGLPAPELRPSNPWDVGEVTLADSNCQPARQRRGKPGTEDRRWRGEERGEERRVDEERRGMTRGYRCELSRETFVRQLCGVKDRCWVEAGSSCDQHCMYLAVLYKSMQERQKKCQTMWKLTHRGLKTLLLLLIIIIT